MSEADRLFAYALRSVGDHHQAEDLAQRRSIPAQTCRREPVIGHRYSNMPLRVSDRPLRCRP